jgi:hypothetical protein
VYGAFHLTGKAAYDAAIEGPGSPAPRLEVVRMVEQGDVVMAHFGSAVRTILQIAGKTKKRAAPVAGCGPLSAITSGRDGSW